MPQTHHRRTARLVPGTNNGSRRTTILVSPITRTYFILTWSKVSKHKQFLPVHELFVQRREEKEDTKSKVCLSPLPKKLPNSTLLHTRDIRPTPLHPRRGDGRQTKIGEGVKAKSGTLLSQGLTRIESRPPRGAVFRKGSLTRSVVGTISLSVTEIHPG